MSQKVKSYQDFSLIATLTDKYVENYGTDYKFTEKSLGFIFFILEKYFNLQEDEIYNSITDSIFVTRTDKYNDKEHFEHDKGIDAIIIDEENQIVHLFNFKYYTKDFKKVKDKHYEGGEISKVKTFINDIFEKNIPNNSNPVIQEKLNELFIIQDKGIRFQFKIHFCSNIFLGFTDDEEDELNVHFKENFGEDVKFDYILVSHIIERVLQRTQKIDAKVRVLGRNYFEKSEYGYRTIIFEIFAKDLIRLVIKDKNIRNNIDAEDNDIKEQEIDEISFEDNVRIYLKQRTNINKNIKNTALDEKESSKFFYFNNGITITCDKFDYQGKSNFVLSIFGLQVVNGSQTIHSLKEAFDEDSENFEDISLLCRINEITDPVFKNNIAEYTNNQNAVSNRDVRSVDISQVKLEKELLEKGFYYERKKNQYEDKPKIKRIDAEKFAQAYLSFYLNLPAEAKNKKSIIFSNKYNDIFNENITAEKVLEVYELYRKIENKKLELKNIKEFLKHASYYVLYFIKVLKELDRNKDKDFFDLYDDAVKSIEIIREKEQHRLLDKFSDAVLFKGNIPKGYLTELGLPNNE